MRMSHQEIPFWDYRHPVKQVANAYISAYRDQYPDEPDLPALEYAVNAALADISAMGYVVYADGTNLVVDHVSLSLVRHKGKNVVNIQFYPPVYADE
jgi:uncharacterized protein with ATP-grasp and redox domains